MVIISLVTAGTRGLLMKTKRLWRGKKRRSGSVPIFIHAGCVWEGEGGWDRYCRYLVSMIASWHT